MVKAVVVGSGPNGLAGAVRLAQHGVEVTVLEASDRLGGGARTTEEPVTGTLHDRCSAVHPTAVLSPFLRTLGLERYGLRWRHPEVMLAHPLDDGTAAVMRGTAEETAAGLPGEDGARWLKAFGPLAAHVESTADDLLGPLLRWPSHPVHLARFGLRAAPPAALMRRWWRSPATQSLFLGVAAHVMHDLHAPMTSSVAAMLIAAGHRFGWPVAEGGSQAITDALTALLLDLGGKTVTGTGVESSSDLPDADVVLLDTAPSAAVRILGDRIPPRVRRAYGRWRHGPAAFKVDFAVRGGVPWSNAACGAAGTVHLGGGPDEVLRTAREVHRGTMPAAPFVLVGQQYLADPSRSAGDVHPVWAYAHVPRGHAGDATTAIIGQIERFAPGFGERIVAHSVKDPAELERGNANYVGGNILTGADDPFQLVFRPRLTPHPYDTGVPGVYLCSAATPPGAGVHGMGGYHAAGRALATLGTRAGRTATSWPRRRAGA
ncbi:NAD(P)/FAD-dependent oxidoreductase [Lentzea sp. CC55]|nr:NAD(P)/FAD-dependent oxidoreductase [Lentzea sp. CC55]